MNNLVLVVFKDSRLCKDGFFRKFAMFGTLPECVKTYKSVGAARNVAKLRGARVSVVPEGMRVEAGGIVIETVPCEDQPGYHTVKHHDLSEFFLPE
jgi:hypothetical protein